MREVMLYGALLTLVSFGWSLWQSPRLPIALRIFGLLLGGSAGALALLIVAARLGLAEPGSAAALPAALRELATEKLAQHRHGAGLAGPWSARTEDRP